MFNYAPSLIEGKALITRSEKVKLGLLIWRVHAILRGYPVGVAIAHKIETCNLEVGL